MWGEGWGGKSGRLKWSSKELIMSWIRVAAILRKLERSLATGREV